MFSSFFFRLGFAITEPPVGSEEAIRDAAASSWTATVFLLLAGTAFLWIGRTLSTRRRWSKWDDDGSTGSTGGGCDIPWAPGAVPILGHALLYRRDPSGFLMRTLRTLRSPVFRVDMAGKAMVLVCGPDAQRQVAERPESALSARRAVADIGFEQTLGRKNVHQGTAIQRGIIRGALPGVDHHAAGFGATAADRQVRDWSEALRRSFREEVGTSVAPVRCDLLHTVRRAVLRTTVEVMVGGAFLKGWTEFDFLGEFMSFQDALEDVTAKAVVLPRWLALVAMLRPFQRRRLVLQRKIEGRLRTVLGQHGEADENGIGFWLRDVLRAGPERRDLSDVAEYVVGLLFAAHKNPAIGAAQAYLMLRELAPIGVLEECIVESRRLMADPTWECLRSSCPGLRRVCLETLRLTAHSIGAVRLARQDVTISVRTGDGTVKLYTIPKGATVGLTHIASSLDPAIWGDDAARFAVGGDDGRSAELYQDEYKFTVFSHGVHRCPGQQLAVLIVEATVAILLTDYDVKLPDAVPPLSFERATLAQRAGPVPVSITRRVGEEEGSPAPPRPPQQ